LTAGVEFDSTHINWGEELAMDNNEDTEEILKEEDYGDEEFTFALAALTACQDAQDSDWVPTKYWRARAVKKGEPATKKNYLY